jgi:hypothetical protein
MTETISSPRRSCENVLVEFKTIGPIFEKERDGLKPNTLRKIDLKDKRFGMLRNGRIRFIRIVNPGTKESFVREVTDYTEWEGWAIISWRKESPRCRLWDEAHICPRECGGVPKEIGGGKDGGVSLVTPLGDKGGLGGSSSVPGSASPSPQNKETAKAVLNDGINCRCKAETGTSGSVPAEATAKRRICLPAADIPQYEYEVSDRLDGMVSKARCRIVLSWIKQAARLGYEKGKSVQLSFPEFSGLLAEHDRIIKIQEDGRIADALRKRPELFESLASQVKITSEIEGGGDLRC